MIQTVSSPARIKLDRSVTGIAEKLLSRIGNGNNRGSCHFVLGVVSTRSGLEYAMCKKDTDLAQKIMADFDGFIGVFTKHARPEDIEDAVLCWLHQAQRRAA